MVQFTRPGEGVVAVWDELRFWMFVASVVIIALGIVSFVRGVQGKENERNAHIQFLSVIILLTVVVATDNSPKTIQEYAFYQLVFGTWWVCIFLRVLWIDAIAVIEIQESENKK